MEGLVVGVEVVMGEAVVGELLVAEGGAMDQKMERVDCPMLIPDLWYGIHLQGKNKKVTLCTFTY